MEIEFEAVNNGSDEHCETILIDPADLICSEDEYEPAEDNMLVSEVVIGPPTVCIKSALKCPLDFKLNLNLYFLQDDSPRSNSDT